MAFDNLSGISNFQSDALCRIATGGGFSTRTLHKNDEETVFEFIRPIIINGIDSLATRSDLLERSLLVMLPTISEDQRLTEEELKLRQEQVLPRVFGALLTAVSQGLRLLPNIKPRTLPRMADFAKWSMAVEVALGFEPGDFMAAYQDNTYTAHETALEASPVAIAIQRLMEYCTSWRGTSTELLSELENLVDDKTRKSRYWSGNPRSLGKALVRIAPDLRKVGIFYESNKRTGGRRIITLEKASTETPQMPQMANVSPSQDSSSGMMGTTQGSTNQIETSPARKEAFSKTQNSGKCHANALGNATFEQQTEQEISVTRKMSGVSGNENTNLSNLLASRPPVDKVNGSRK